MSEYIDRGHPICGNPDCCDVVADVAPCAEWVRCECGWPAAADPHCASCQHAEECHAVKPQHDVSRALPPGHERHLGASRTRYDTTKNGVTLETRVWDCSCGGLVIDFATQRIVSEPRA